MTREGTPRQRVRAKKLALRQLIRRHAAEYRALYRAALRVVRDRDDRQQPANTTEGRPQQ